MDEDWRNDPRLNIFEINEFSIEYKDGSEVEVPSHWVEKAWFLGLSKKIRWAFRPFRNWAEGNRFWTGGAPSWIWLFILVCNDGPAKIAAIFDRWSILGQFRFYASWRIIRTTSFSCVSTHHARFVRSRKIWFLFWWTLFSLPFLLLVIKVLVGKNLYALGSKERGYKAWFNYIIFLNKLSNANYSKT